MFFLISNLYTAYENVDHIIAFIKPNFFLPNYRCSFLFFHLCSWVRFRLKYCRVTLSVLSFHTFLSAAPSPSFILPLSIFHLAPLHHSSSPDLLISHLTQSFDLSCSFPFSCILYVFSPFSYTLFTSMSASSILGGGWGHLQSSAASLR